MYFSVFYIYFFLLKCHLLISRKAIIKKGKKNAKNVFHICTFLYNQATQVYDRELKIIVKRIRKLIITITSKKIIKS